MHKCKLCSESFESEVNLILHFQTHITSSTDESSGELSEALEESESSSLADFKTDWEKKLAQDDSKEGKQGPAEVEKDLQRMDAECSAHGSKDEPAETKPKTTAPDLFSRDWPFKSLKIVFHLENEVSVTGAEVDTGWRKDGDEFTFHEKITPEEKQMYERMRDQIPDPPEGTSAEEDSDLEESCSSSEDSWLYDLENLFYPLNLSGDAIQPDVKDDTKEAMSTDS